MSVFMHDQRNEPFERTPAMTKEKVAELLRRAFMEGFAISREGFNGECAFDHLAPDGLRLKQLRDITVDAIIQDEWQQD